jgi:hypothetical protein
LLQSNSGQQRATFGDDGFMRPCRSDIGPRLEGRFRNHAVAQAGGHLQGCSVRWAAVREGPKIRFFGAGFRHQSLQYRKYQIYKKDETDMFECSPAFLDFIARSGRDLIKTLMLDDTSILWSVRKRFWTH